MPATKLTRAVWRLLGVYLLLLVAAAVLAIPLGLDKNSLAAILAFEGIAWFAVAFLVGGSVETYRAPLMRPSLVFTLPDKDRYVLPSDSPEAVEDVRQKLSSQTGPMVFAALSGLGFFGLAAVVFYAPVIGFLVLLVTVGLVGILLVRGGTRN